MLGCITLLVCMTAQTAIGSTVDAASAFPPLITLQNDEIFLEMNASYGYAITGFGALGGLNLINHHDEGRECQISLYAGPSTYNPGGKCSGKWRDSWPWNPIQAGDVYGHHGTAVSVVQVNASAAYVETIPLQWACDLVPCECRFAKWVVLRGAVAEISAQLLNNRSDHTDYGPYGQELPAVYTISPLSQLVTYNGSAPFTGAPVAYPPTPSTQPPWSPGKSPATEGWAAFLDPRSGKGVGVVHPGLQQFNMGFHGPKGPGTPTSDPTGYLAPYAQVDLLWNSEFKYQSALVYGNLSAIRAYAYQKNSHRVHSDTQARMQHTFAHKVHPHRVHSAIQALQHSSAYQKHPHRVTPASQALQHPTKTPPQTSRNQHLPPPTKYSRIPLYLLNYLNPLNPAPLRTSSAIPLPPQSLLVGPPLTHSRSFTVSHTPTPTPSPVLQAAILPNSPSFPTPAQTSNLTFQLPIYTTSTTATFSLHHTGEILERIVLKTNKSVNIHGVWKEVGG